MFSKFIALILLTVSAPILLLVSLIIVWSDKTPIIFRQKRIGLDNQLFLLYKFRTMKNNTPNIATHLIKDPSKYYIKMGLFFRKLSFDELPQLFNIIKGDMVFIGPRPALYNQDDLIKLRTNANLHKIKPGITGWAQINGRDSISIEEKVDLEKYYLRNKSLLLDTKIIVLTFLKVFLVSDVDH